MKSIAEAGYNKRLFSGGFRRRLHTARFSWLRRKLLQLKCHYDSVLELGCFDGKLIEFLPVAPSRYLGFDANWEGGLDIAVEKWKDHQGYVFRFCEKPSQMDISGNEQFDIAVIMETLEHVRPDLVDPYIEKIVEHTSKYVFITVPNEKGLVFLAKWSLKRVLSNDAEPYTLREVLNTALGRLNKVQRREHKGFDYSSLINQLKTHLNIIEVEGIPLTYLPCSLNFNVGIVGRVRKEK